MTSTDVFNLYRSLYSFKNMLTNFKNETVKIIEIARVTVDPQIEDFGPPGQLRFCKKLKKLLVKCCDGNSLEIKQLSVGKKKAMTAMDFNNGFLKKCETSEKCFR